MAFIRENWWYILLLVGFGYMMTKGGGCCGGGHGHGGSSQGGHDHSGHGHTGHMNNQIETVIDPVCGMHINPETAIKQDIDGKTYYFCSENCRSTFVNNTLK